MLLRSIRSRLLALVVATVIPFGILICAGLWSQWQSDQAAAIQQSINDARILAAQIDDHIGNLENLLTGLSEAVSPEARDTEANDARLRRVRGQQPSIITHIGVYLPDGTNIGSSDAELGRVNASGRAYLDQILAGERLSIGDVVVGRLSNRWTINFGRPVEDAEGHLRAVLVVGTKLEEFPKALRLQDLPTGSVVTVVNEKGIVIARSQEAERFIGRSVATWRHLPKHFGEREGADASFWVDADGVEHATAFSTLHRAPWLVVIGLPKRSLFASVATRLGWGALFAAIALLVGFAIAWVLSARVIKPLHQLGRDASLLASGNLSHRSAIVTRDEVGMLADDFNRMAAALERRAHEAHCAADEIRQTMDTLAAVIDASPVAIVCCDVNRRTVLWNPAAEKMFGYTAEEVIGMRSRLARPNGANDSQRLFERARNGETVRNLEVMRARKDGSLVHVRVAAAPMYNLDGTVRGVARAYEDITESKRAEEQLSRLAHYDPLTGLPNRLSLQKELACLLASCTQRPFAIALFDLDGFKDVNDTLGHSTGDQLLIEVCRRFIEVTDGLARSAKVCRLGGDEFVIVVPDCADPRTIGEIVDLLLKRLKDPFEVSGNVLHLGSSAGIAIAPNDATQADELIANADLALYQAKADGGHVARFFLPALRARAQARRALGVELRRAFAENEFELYYQPQIRLADEAVLGAEALLRWRHPQRGLIAPGAFIDALAECSIAPEVGRWIIATAARQMAAWHEAGLMLGRVGVNLFPAQAHSGELIRDVEDALAASGLSPDLLELEITENAALNVESSSTGLRRVQALGVRLAFDDFGTGYASLNHLTQFPIWRIKIDRSFVNRITASVDDAAIVRSLIAMAHNLGLRVVAEGVETAEQAAFLLREGCEEAQGYLYAKPLAAADFEAFLQGRNCARGDEIANEARRALASAQRSASRRKLRRA